MNNIAGISLEVEFSACKIFEKLAEKKIKHKNVLYIAKARKRGAERTGKTHKKIQLSFCFLFAHDFQH